MVKIEGLVKTFEGFKALDNLNLSLKKGSIYGLVGVNGSGKTTIIKHLTGLYKQDSGTVEIDGQTVYDNAVIKSRMGYIADDLYFYPNYTLKAYGEFYKGLYGTWDNKRYTKLVDEFGLNQKKNINRFSKGMQKQAAFCLNMAIMPDILILDEPIDGLDPFVRRNVIRNIVEDVAEREMTVLVSSHNLKEMEGICDSIGIVSDGKMMIQRDLDDLKTDIHKVQVAFDKSEDAEEFLSQNLNVLSRETRGSVETLIVRGKAEDISKRFRSVNPLIYDLLPLTLEEIFIYETEAGYNESAN